MKLSETKLLERETTPDRWREIHQQNGKEIKKILTTD